MPDRVEDEEQPGPRTGDESRMSRWLNRVRTLASRLDPEEPELPVAGIPPPTPRGSSRAADPGVHANRNLEQIAEELDEPIAPGQPSLFEAPPVAPVAPVAAPVVEVPVEAPIEAMPEPELPQLAPLDEPETAIVLAAMSPAAAIETPMPPPVPPLTAEAEETPLPDPDAESPEEIAEEEREAALIVKGGLFSRFAWPTHPHYWNGYLALLTGLGTLAFLMFVLVEPSPRWILLVVALAVTAGLDGALRVTWRVPFASGEDTTPYLFLPALYVFAAPLLIEHNVTGHVAILWALLAGVGFGAVVVAEVLSVRTGSWLYPYARMVTTGTAYIAAFSLFSMTYVLNLGLVPALLGTWFLATMLAIEVVREGEVDPVETVIFGALAGLVVAQVRWLLFYLPMDGYLAGLALVLVFYFVTGVLHSYVTRQLTAITATEYALVTTIGVILVGAARVAGLA